MRLPYRLLSVLLTLAIALPPRPLVGGLTLSISLSSVFQTEAINAAPLFQPFQPLSPTATHQVFSEGGAQLMGPRAAGSMGDQIEALQNPSHMRALTEELVNRLAALNLAEGEPVALTIEITKGNGFRCKVEVPETADSRTMLILPTALADPLLRVGIESVRLESLSLRELSGTIHSLCRGEEPPRVTIRRDWFVASNLGLENTTKFETRIIAAVAEEPEERLGRSLLNNLENATQFPRIGPYFDHDILSLLAFRTIHAVDQIQDRAFLIPAIQSLGNIQQELLKRLSDTTLSEQSRGQLGEQCRHATEALIRIAKEDRSSCRTNAVSSLFRNVSYGSEVSVPFSAEFWGTEAGPFLVHLLLEHVQSPNGHSPLDMHTSLSALTAIPILEASVANGAAAVLFSSFINSTLIRMKTDAQGDRDRWFWAYGPGPVLVDAWKAIDSRGSDQLKAVFYHSWAEIAVHEENLGHLMEFGALGPEIAGRIMALLVAVYETRNWTFNEQTFPWGPLLLLINQTTSTNDLMMKRMLMDALLRQFTGTIGLAEDDNFRVISRSDLELGSTTIDADIYDLDRFIHREIHHGLGTHTLDLIKARFEMLLTGDASDALRLCAKFGEVQTRTWRKYVQSHAVIPDPVVVALFRDLSIELGQPLMSLEIESLVTAPETALRATRAKLENEFPGSKERIAELFDKQIVVYRVLHERFHPETLANALILMAKYSKGNKFEVDPSALLRAIRTQASPSNMMKALIEFRGQFSSKMRGDPDFREEVVKNFMREKDMHEISRPRGGDPNDPTMRALMLDEYLKPIEEKIISLSEEAYSRAEGPQEFLLQSRRLLSDLIALCEVSGLATQHLRELKGLLDSPNTDMDRLVLITDHLLLFAQDANRRLDLEIGPMIDAVSSVLRYGDGSKRLLASMNISSAEEYAHQRRRLRTHLQGILLRKQVPLARLRDLAGIIHERAKSYSLSEPTLRVMPGTGRGEQGIAIIPESLDFPLSIEDTSEKVINLLRLVGLIERVPPGFSYPIGTPLGVILRTLNGKIFKLEEAIREKGWDVHFGSSFGPLSENPILVSVRSGAIFDAPGQLPSVTNVGISPQTIDALAKRIGQWAAWDSYRRFLQEYAMTVFGMNRSIFDGIMEEYKNEMGVEKKSDLTPSQMIELAELYHQAIVTIHGHGAVPGSLEAQLERIIPAIQRAWSSDQLLVYRRREHMMTERGTAILVQAMVFGNYSKDREGEDVLSGDGETSGAGVAMSGRWSWDLPEGSWAHQVQGFDIADGVVTPENIDVLRHLLPRVFQELQTQIRIVHEVYKSKIHFEYTIQNGVLWILQVRGMPEEGNLPSLEPHFLQSAQRLADGFGLCGRAVKGPIITIERLINESRFADSAFVDRLKRVVRDMRLNEPDERLRPYIGLIVLAKQATPELAQYLWPENGVSGLIADIGGPGTHENEMAQRLGLTAVAGLSHGALSATMIVNHKKGLITFEHAEGTISEIKEGDIVSLSVENKEGKVVLGNIPFAFSHTPTSPSLRTHGRSPLLLEGGA